MKAVVAYGVRLTGFAGVPLDLMDAPDDNGLRVMYGRVGRTGLHLFLVAYHAGAEEGDVVAFQPVSPRRHLWDAYIETLAQERGWKTTEPDWLLFQTPRRESETTITGHGWTTLPDSAWSVTLKEEK